MLSLFYGHDKKTKSINREHVIWEKFKRPGYHLRLINYYSLLLVASPCRCIFHLLFKKGDKEVLGRDAFVRLCCLEEFNY